MGNGIIAMNNSNSNGISGRILPMNCQAIKQRSINNSYINSMSLLCHESKPPSEF